MYLTENETNFNVIDFDNYNSVIGTTISGVVIGLKACIMSGLAASDTSNLRSKHESRTENGAGDVANVSRTQQRGS
jgi:hypothetical protein